ncbi:MAG TPA: hypothetical protein VJ371_16125 [Streptosporangiaceae bacterium]|jgi:hypothetical protein|nr:hypothetical protein [Streptosporangiaceae bacterium]
MNTSFSWRLSRSATLVLAAGLVSGAAFAAATGISSASTATPTTTAATATVTAAPGAWSDPGGAWSGPGGAWSGPWAGPGGPWSGPGGPWGGGAPDSSGRTEYFHVASTKAAGPGAIIVTGVFTDGGIEHPGRSVDNAVFGDGTFRIDHSAGHPATSFNSKTCVGTITQTGPFRVYDGTGRFSGLQGSGTYWFAATYTTARTAAGCTTTMTAYIETINGVLTVGS